MNIHQPGSRIVGRFEVTSLPLMGGMGIVYLCFDHQVKRPVALKTFRPEYLSNHELRKRFLREGELWAQLKPHPHIVRAYNVFRTDKGRDVYLILELVAKNIGRKDASMRSWLSPGKSLPIFQTLMFGLQITRGMQHLTRSFPNFVHRDLKPENVLISCDRLPGTLTARR